MPRIPDYTAAGTTVPRTATPRFPADRSERIVAEGREALVGAVGAAVERAVDHDDKLRYASARGALLREQIAARKELEGDANYQTYESRFVERTAKARTAAAANIRGARSRELFEIDAQADIDRGLEQIRGLARAREVDEGIATMNNDLESNRTAALESSDPIERGALVQASLDSIDGTFKKGYIKETEAGALREKFKANYGEAFVGIQTPAERIKLLEKPDDNVAKFIAPDRRKVLLEAAKKDNDEVRIRGESQAYFDGYIEKYGGDFNAAIKAARTDLKKDPLVRDATESRLAEEQQRTKARQVETRENAYNNAVEKIDSGVAFADLNLTNIPGPQQASLRRYAEGGGKNARLESDRDTTNELEKLFADAQLTDAGAKAFAQFEVDTVQDKLTDKDRALWRQRVTDVRSGKLGGKDVGLQTILQQREAAIKELQKAGELKTPADINFFNAQLDSRLKGFAEDNKGTPPGLEEARKIINSMKAGVIIKEPWWKPDTQKPAYKITSKDVDVPEMYRRLIIEDLQSVGQPVTKEAIESRYQKLTAKPVKKVDPNASTTPMSDTLRRLEAQKRAEDAAKKPAPKATP